MARRGTGKQDHRDNAIALAKAIHAAMLAYNRRFPHTPFAIDDTTSRILENDPDYHPPRKRVEGKRREPTVNPGIFTVMRIARELDTVVGELLAERGYEVTNSDLRSFRWIADFLRMRYPIDDLPALGDERRFVEKDLSRPRRLETTKIDKAGDVAAGQTPVESDFEMTEADIVGPMNQTTLVTAQVKGRSMADRIRDGDTIVIDTSRTMPRQHEPVAVYVENEGGVLGYWRAEAGTYYLDKHNTEVPSVRLGHPSEWRVIGVITHVQSRVSRQDRPARPDPR